MRGNWQQSNTPVLPGECIKRKWVNAWDRRESCKSHKMEASVCLEGNVKVSQAQISRWNASWRKWDPHLWSTGWPFSLCRTSRWLQNKCSHEISMILLTLTRKELLSGSILCHRLSTNIQSGFNSFCQPWRQQPAQLFPPMHFSTVIIGECD